MGPGDASVQVDRQAVVCVSCQIDGQTNGDNRRTHPHYITFSDTRQLKAIDVLVDTGSSHLLLPTSLCDASSCVTEEGPVLQTLDLEAAGAAVVECDDPRCQVHFHVCGEAIPYSLYIDLI